MGNHSGMTAALALLVFGCSLASAADIDVTKDREFVGKAAQGGQFEVAAGRLAGRRGLDPAVKEFGQQMVTDHTAVNVQLKSLTDSKQWPLEKSLAAEQEKALAKLESLSGSEFDKTYTKMMVKDHVEDIAEFENELKKGEDASVKAFAQSAIPTLRHHLTMANKLEAAAKKNP